MIGAGDWLEDTPPDSQIVLLMAPNSSLEERWQAAMARHMPGAVTVGCVPPYWMGTHCSNLLQMNMVDGASDAGD